MTIDDRLREGYANFKASTFEKDKALYSELAENGQKPHTLVISCSDSRVPPQHILSADPGDLFVVRNVAASVSENGDDTADNSTAAAIEFAVTALGVDNIIIIGHTGCGGVASVIDDSVPHESFVGKWMAPLRSWLSANDVAKDKSNSERKAWLEKAAVNRSLNNLKTFPFVAERAGAGTLQLKGFIFNIQTGDLSEVVPVEDGSYSLAAL
ncbi:MAG: carbonic anhydrase [Kordiimonas sp.]